MKEELAIRAAKLFKDLFPDVWRHELNISQEGAYKTPCLHCDKYYRRELDRVVSKWIHTPPDGKCNLRPIDINDWNVAMKLFRSLDACQRTNAHSELVQIFLREIDDDRGTPDELVAVNDPTELMLSTDTWFWNFGEPKHLIEAACRAKEAENEAM